MQGHQHVSSFGGHTNFFFKFGIPGTAVSDISLYKIFIEEWDLCGCVDEDKCIASTSLVSGNARVTADCCRHYVFGLFVCLSACVHTCVCVSGQRHSPICLLSTSSCLPGVHSGWPPNVEYMEKPGNLRLVQEKSDKLAKVADNVFLPEVC